MCSTHNEGKSIADQWLIRTLRNKIYKFMTLISKNVYIGKLDNLVNKYNNSCHSAIKIKPADVKDPKFNIGDIVRISNYKNVFCKRLHPKLV